ncbi:hypothetical protein GCM10027026_36140 [Myroides odoratimimus subsp. xuanwuensis]
MAPTMALLMALAALLVVPAAPASADSSYLCKGYATCKQAGYGHAGYAQQGSTMWWRMYAGHNCTNYVAYRLVRGGMPNVRPWSGSGNATNWGVAMSSITDGTPMVGAIAWWRAGTPGGGSSGHVAYIEQVVSSSEIVVSEDSWGGDFSWRRITRSGRGWPTGFIHFNDATVLPTAPPAVEGTPAVGTTLRASAGAWKPVATPSVQWLADGAVIPGATAETFTPTRQQRGKQLSVRVTATRPGYVAGSAVSTTTPAVELGTLRTATPPAISGNAQVDEVLTATPGTFEPTPTTSTIQWHADGEPILGATGWQLRLGQAQVDRTITAVVSAQTAGYRKAVVSSAATGPVLAPDIEVQQAFALAGWPRLGRELTVRPGTFSPADARVAYTWLRDGRPIAGATGPSYLLAPEDIGSRVSVRVDLSRTGYRSASETLAANGPVQTSSKLVIAGTGAPGKAVLDLDLTVAGAAAPSGKVTLRIGGRTLVRRVVDGRAHLLIRGLKAGRQVVRASYAGTAVFSPASARLVLRVPRRR